MNKEMKSQKLSAVMQRWMNQLFDPIRFAKSLPAFINYFKDWRTYSRLEYTNEIKLIDTYPCLNDKTSTTGIDEHYFYQDNWAFRKIYKSKCKCHVDVGSSINFIGFLSTFTKVIFVDIRPLTATLDNLYTKKGSIISLPFDNDSVKSLSCLHVAEHIGLGRYGDSIDPLGTKKACKELSRVLAPEGNLYFSVPIGRPRLCFNAHRIHTAQQIIDYFSSLELIEFSGIDDKGNFMNNINISNLENADYGCGLFLFRKKK